jgi:hypothetical protein
MSEIYYRMSSFDGIGVDAPNGDAVIVGSLGPDNELQVAIPLDDLPLLETMLSQAYAQASAALPQRSLGTSLIAEAPEFSAHSDQSKVTLYLQLASGVPLAFGFPKEQCADLRSQLDRLLD